MLLARGVVDLERSPCELCCLFGEKRVERREIALVNEHGNGVVDPQHGLGVELEMRGALEAYCGAVGDENNAVEESCNAAGGCNAVDGRKVVDEGCNPVDKGCNTVDDLTGVGLGSPWLLPPPAVTSISSICCSLTSPSFAWSFVVGDRGFLDGRRLS